MLQSPGLCGSGKPSADILNMYYSDCSLEEQPREDISNLISRLSPNSEAKTFNELLSLLKIKGRFVEDCKKFVSTYLKEQVKEGASNDIGRFNEKQMRSPEITKNKICFLIVDEKTPFWIEIDRTCSKLEFSRNLLAYK